MSGVGGLRHILVKSVQWKFGFHYALIAFCQFSARYHCCQWSNSLSYHLCLPQHALEGLLKP